MPENPVPYDKVSLYRKTTCCPELIIDGNEVIIIDEFGGKVKMTVEQMEVLLSEALNHPLIDLMIKLSKEQVISLLDQIGDALSENDSPNQ